MKTLIQQRKTIENQIETLKNNLESNESIMLKKINPILHIMNKIEKEILIDKKEELKSINLSLYPIGTNVYNIESIKIKKNLIKFTESYYDGCGDYTKITYKIPVDYFSLSEEEIISIHKEWSLKDIERKIEKRKIKDLKEKEAKIQYLQNQINNLK